MGRQVPAVERALEILELLADRTPELLGLSEIARILAMNKASCHATLTLLAERNYLIRHADKTYSLGPGMLPIANSFLHDQDALPFARVEMSTLGRELNLDCVASSVFGSEIVVLAHTPSPGSFGINMRVGSRFPLVPPLGTVFLAWAGRYRVERWLAGLDQQTAPAKREHYLDALATVRARGYSVAIGKALGENSGGASDLDDYHLFELRETQHLPVAHVAVPVFDPEGTVRLALTVVAFRDQLTSQKVPALVERLTEATVQVTRATWGVDPGTSHTSSIPVSGPPKNSSEGRGISDEQDG
jgi:DNA-binding IclR family transcriptional regulator